MLSSVFFLICMFLNDRKLCNYNNVIVCEFEIAIRVLSCCHFFFFVIHSDKVRLFFLNYIYIYIYIYKDFLIAGICTYFTVSKLQDIVIHVNTELSVVISRHVKSDSLLLVLLTDWDTLVRRQVNYPIYTHRFVSRSLTPVAQQYEWLP